jgi:ankyrin repeat protein
MKSKRKKIIKRGLVVFFFGIIYSKMDLIEAVERNDVKSIKAIIAGGGGGVDLNYVNNAGRTALFEASNDGFVECVKALLKAKANTEKPDRNGNTPFNVASLNGHLECVKVKF